MRRVNLELEIVNNVLFNHKKTITLVSFFMLFTWYTSDQKSAQQELILKLTSFFAF